MLIFRPTSGPNNRRGLTIVELIISSALLGLLMLLIFFLYFNSHRAWKKNYEHQEVMGDLQIAVGFLSEELQAAPFPSITIDGDNAALSFLTLKDDDGRSSFTDDGRPLWHHWLVYYASGQELIRQKVDWPEPDPILRELPTALPDFSSQPLATFRTGEGRRLSRQLEEFSVTNPTGTQLIEYRLAVRRKSNLNNIITLEGVIRPRN